MAASKPLKDAATAPLNHDRASGGHSGTEFFRQNIFVY